MNSLWLKKQRNSKDGGQKQYELCSPVRREGYLFKKSHRKLRLWIRRWFMIQGNQIVYKVNPKHMDRQNIAILVNDTRLCNVRVSENESKKFGFELNSPKGQHFLRADTGDDRQQWIEAINQSISDSLCHSIGGSNAYLSTSTDGSISQLSCESGVVKINIVQQRKDIVAHCQGNDSCADCGQEKPDWVAVNIGCLLCMKCSGIHRGMGVGISKVRSLHMDDWDIETLIMLSQLGNRVVNNIFEATLSSQVLFVKPTPASAMHCRRAYIEAKYVRKLFVRLKRKSNARGQNETITGCYSADHMLHDAVKYHRNLTKVLEALAQDANIDCRLGDLQRTPLILAVDINSIPLIEFLLLNNADSSLCDNQGQSAMHRAVIQSISHRCQVIILIKRNVPFDLVDKAGMTALDYALERMDPDIVTWLRMINLHKQLAKDDPKVEKAFLPFLEDPAYILELTALY